MDSPTDTMEETDSPPATAKFTPAEVSRMIRRVVKGQRFGRPMKQLTLPSGTAYRVGADGTHYYTAHDGSFRRVFPKKKKHDIL